MFAQFENKWKLNVFICAARADKHAEILQAVLTNMVQR